MVINNGYEEQTRRLLAETKSELDAIERQIAELEGKRATLRSDAQGLETALEVYLRRAGKQFISEPDWEKLLEGLKTHKDRLKAIAKYKGGEIRVSEATDILYTKGFMQAKKRMTAYTMVQINLADMAKHGIFQKIGPGEYRLMPTQRSLLGVSSR